jgi:hypothetical protein
LPKQFSIDAFYPHREHLPAKVRTFIDLLVEDLRQIDWNPRGDNGERSPVIRAAASIDRPSAPKRTNSAVKGPDGGRRSR